MLFSPLIYVLTVIHYQALRESTRPPLVLPTSATDSCFTASPLPAHLDSEGQLRSEAIRVALPKRVNEHFFLLFVRRHSLCKGSVDLTDDASISALMSLSAPKMSLNENALFCTLDDAKVYFTLGNIEISQMSFHFKNLCHTAQEVSSTSSASVPTRAYQMIQGQTAHTYAVTLHRFAMFFLRTNPEYLPHWRLRVETEQIEYDGVVFTPGTHLLQSILLCALGQPYEVATKLVRDFFSSVWLGKRKLKDIEGILYNFVIAVCTFSLKFSFSYMFSLFVNEVVLGLFSK